jgi:hypothetical protein
MAELGIAAIALGHIINHRSVTKAGVTLSVYAHYDYVGEKAEALDLHLSGSTPSAGEGRRSCRYGKRDGSSNSNSCRSLSRSANPVVA